MGGGSGYSGGGQIAAYMNQGVPIVPSGFGSGVAMPNAGPPNMLSQQQLSPLLSQVTQGMPWIQNYVSQLYGGSAPNPYGGGSGPGRVSSAPATPQPTPGQPAGESMAPVTLSPGPTQPGPVTAPPVAATTPGGGFPALSGANNFISQLYGGSYPYYGGGSSIAR